MIQGDFIVVIDVAAFITTINSRKRLAIAEKYVSTFAIATECGFGRRDPRTIPELLRIHAEVADT